MIFRVFKLDKGTAGLRIYVDLAEFEANGQLAFAAEDGLFSAWKNISLLHEESIKGLLFLFLDIASEAFRIAGPSNWIANVTRDAICYSGTSYSHMIRTQSLARKPFGCRTER